MDGKTVTEEDELPGAVQSDALGDDGIVSDHTAEALAAVLAALRSVPWFPSAKALPVLSEADPLWSQHTSWASAFAALMERAYAKDRSLPARDVPELSQLADGLIDAVRQVVVPEAGIVHGDLFGDNVLYDGGRIASVLDFGFVTCAGDPNLDAAIVGLIADQYGPRARDSERKLDELMADRLGTERNRIVLYKAAYALVTSGYFSPDGSDGHYPWCVRILNRPEVRELALQR